MDNRKFYCYLAPLNDPHNNGVVREVVIHGINYAAAEYLVKDFMQPDEYIKRIEQDLP